MSGEARTGVYICRGCGIGAAVDTAALEELATGSEGVVTTRLSDAFCLEDAALIASDVASEGVSTAVVAACSARVNRAKFSFPPAAVRRVNLREQVAWCHEPQEEATQELAQDLLRMGIASAPYSQAPTPYTADHEHRVLVVGAGPAGLASAAAAADAGFEVILVESAATAGGFLRRIARGYPTAAGALDTLAEFDPDSMIAQVLERPAVSLRTSTTVTSVSGQPGRFTAQLQGPAGSEEVTAGSVIMATGFEPVKREHFAHYGLDRVADVVTSVEFERMAADGKLVRPSDGAPARRVAILACDGPQDSANLPYTGVTAAMVALKQAQYVAASAAGAEAFLVYEDLQTTGTSELYYRHVQQQPGIYLVRGHVTAVSDDPSGALALSVSASVLARPVSLQVDLVVLQVGMVPTSAPDASEPVNLNLGYLQGPQVPTQKAGFVDSNFICFPFETRRTGIYAAGSVHRLGGVTEARTDGAAAALKAVQVIEKATSGAAVHPRVGDLGYPNFFLQQCTSCGRCTQECPFGAIELDAQRHPAINPNRCRRCGICMGACPVQVISFTDYSVEMISDMQKSLELPDDDDKPRVLVLACENDAYPALDMVGINHLRYPAEFRVIPVRCLGSVNAVVVADAVQMGYDGVALLGCRSGDDYQCHFIEGSGLLTKRMANVRETLGRMALEEERVQVLETSIADAHRLPGVLSGLAEQLAELGPNPMKGF